MASPCCSAQLELRSSSLLGFLFINSFKTQFFSLKPHLSHVSPNKCPSSWCGCVMWASKGWEPKENLAPAPTGTEGWPVAPLRRAACPPLPAARWARRGCGRALDLPWHSREMSHAQPCVSGLEQGAAPRGRASGGPCRSGSHAVPLPSWRDSR